MSNERITAELLLHTALETAAYIDTKKVEDENGVRWSLKDAFSGKHFCNDEISLYSGSAGIGKFLLDLWELTGEASFRNEAVAAADYMLYRWENKRPLDKNFSLFAYTTGYSGVAEYLLKIAALTQEKKYSVGAEKIIAACIADAQTPPDGRGRFWSSYPGIIGDAGTILFLLHAAEICSQPQWKSFAIKAGEFYLGKGHPYGEGMYYDGVDPAYFDSGPELIDPNYPMGTAGIGFLLLKLYEASGDRSFLEAESPVLPFLRTVAVRQRRGILLPHALPDRADLFYLGYCHGPAGTIRYLYQGQKSRGQEEYREFGNALLSGLLAVGAPAKRSAGYWNVHNFCCGTAGQINLFTGLLADGKFVDQGQEKLEALVLEAAGVLLNTRTLTGQEDGRTLCFWVQALDRITPNRLSASIGYYEGAAGIADALLTVYRLMTGSFHIERAVDDPFPKSRIPT